MLLVFLSILGLSMLITLLLTPLVRRVAIRFEFLDIPSDRKLHQKPMPLLGGVAVYLGFLIPPFLLLDEVFLQDSDAWPQALAVFAGATMLLTVGIMDDRGKLHPQFKLTVAMPLAGILLCLGGVRIDASDLVSLFSEDPAALFIASSAVTVIWVNAVTAAFSIFDHMDGLCCGVAGVAASFTLGFAIVDGQALAAGLAAAILGASLGFLYWNFHPARIFLGDGGAMLIGFVMATLMIQRGLSLSQHPDGWAMPLLILGIPLFDAVLVSVSRLRRGLIPFSSPGKDHTAHRLAGLGLGGRGAVLVLYLAGAVSGSLAVVQFNTEAYADYILMTSICLFGLVGIYMLERVPFESQEGTRRQPT